MLIMEKLGFFFNAYFDTKPSFIKPSAKDPWLSLLFMCDWQGNSQYL